MAITSLLDDGTIRVEHDIDVAIHPETTVPTRLTTRPYRLRSRPAPGIYPREIKWSYSFYKYRAERDKQAQHEISRGNCVQVWDFPARPEIAPTFKDPAAIERRMRDQMGRFAVGPDGRRYYRLTEDGWV